MPVPRSRWLRILLGSVLLVCGVLGFLPIVGFWMIPLGLFVLSVDIPLVRRWRRRLEVKIGRWQQRRREAKSLADSIKRVPGEASF